MAKALAHPVRVRIMRVLADADGYVQTLNDQFTNPSGEGAEKPQKAVVSVSRETNTAAKQPNPEAISTEPAATGS